MCGSWRRGPHLCSSAPRLSARLSSFCCLSFYLGAQFSSELAVLSSSVMLIGLQHMVSGVLFWAPAPLPRRLLAGDADHAGVCPVFCPAPDFH